MQCNIVDYSFTMLYITSLLLIYLITRSFERRQWHPTPVLLPGKSHGWRSLVGCSPWGREELDTTERLPFLFSLSCIGEGNGNPLQCSCLENPRDRGAWWVAVYGVAQSLTWLKWLSRSFECLHSSCPHPPHAPSLVSTIYSLFPQFQFAQIQHINEMIQHLSFNVWIISFSIIPSRSTLHIFQMAGYPSFMAK